MSLRFICIELLRRFALAAVLALPGGVAAQSIESALSPGPVIEGHVKVEEDCKACHKRFDKAAQTGLCLDCHKETAEDVRSGRRYHGRLKDKECRACHTDHKGRGAKIAEFDKEKFDHSQSGFELRDKHKQAKCDACHKTAKLKYRGTATACYGCHKKDDQEKGHKGHLGEKCGDCHGEKNWTDTKFDHETTKFSLGRHKHAEAKCKDCHQDKTYQDKGAPRNCNACHQKVDNEKGHKGRYGAKCESCHTDRGWKELRFDHDRDTKYALKGKHRPPVKCDACHLPAKGPLYQQKLATKCIACHKGDDQKDGHKGSLGEKCESCHSERGWDVSSFDHDKTEFPLKDKHKDAKCDACHKGGVAGLKAKESLKVDRACNACHKKDDQEKGHKGRYGPKCESCHNAKDWKTISFKHERETPYPLRGKHAKTKCDACHMPERGALYQKDKLETACLACHKKDDKHKNQLGPKCEDCHNEKDWKDAPYDHNKSRFPLTGAHFKVECKKCHQTPAFKDAAKDCNGCHEKDDVHKRRLGTQCESCHNVRTWKSWDFDHNKTKFRLDGEHRKLTCYDCHKKPIEGRATIARACIACHADDDIHSGEFGGQCERCHDASSWRSLPLTERRRSR